MRPLLPPLAVPELKLMWPLTPLSPAFGVHMIASPLDVAEPKPVATSTAPPLDTVDSPENTRKSPPSPVSPAPTVTRMDPPFPLVARSVPIEMLPLLPTLVDPELKLSRPDTPLLPALNVLVVMEPLEVVEP